MDYKIVLDNATHKLVQVLQAATATPGGYTAIGTFSHPDNDLLGSVQSHVLYQHVQEAMYKQGRLDMQSVKITWPGKVEPTALAFNPTSVDLAFGGNTQLVPVFTPAAVSDARLRYFSEDIDVVKVTPSGKVYAIYSGKTVIRAETVNGALVKRIPVNVRAQGEIAVASVTLAPAPTTVVVAATRQLTPTVLPANATNKAVTYTSSDPTKATVNASGLVTGVAAGVTTITVHTVDGNKLGTSVVTVTAT